MKTNFTNSFTVIVTVFAMLTGAASAATNTLSTTELSGLNKLSVSGNVEVCLVQSDIESLGVYNSAASSTAKITFADDELNISSFGSEKLSVIVAVTDLSIIETHGRAVVHTLNTLVLPQLCINLNDSSVANLDLDVDDLSAITNNSSSLKISGTSANQALKIAGMSKMDASDFTLDNTYQLSGRGKLFINNDGERVAVQNKSRKG